MGLKEMMAADVAPGGCFANTDDFAESIVYFAGAGADGIPMDVCPAGISSTRGDQEPHHDLEADLVTYALPKALLAGVVPERGHYITIGASDRKWGWSATLDDDSAAYVVQFSAKRIRQAGQGRPASL